MTEATCGSHVVWTENINSNMQHLLLVYHVVYWNSCYQSTWLPQVTSVIYMPSQVYCFMTYTCHADLMMVFIMLLSKCIAVFLV